MADVIKDSNPPVVPDKLPRNNNTELGPNVLPNQLKGLQSGHGPQSCPEYHQGLVDESRTDVTGDVPSSAQSTSDTVNVQQEEIPDLSVQIEGESETLTNLDTPSEPPGTPLGKLDPLPQAMTSTPLQDPRSASSSTRNALVSEQLLSLSLQTNSLPILPTANQQASLFAPQCGSVRGQGSDSGSRADDEAEVNTSFGSQVSTATVTHESQTDLDLYDQMNVPIVGYEIMEPRNKFTVYKLRVQKSKDEGWHIFRRFSDFVRLNDTLRQVFPHFRLALPPKRWLGDNYNRSFIEDRLLGLQAFLNNVVSHRDVCNSEAVRTFLCIDDPPGPHDSLEESRALCEMLEEKQYQLKQDLQSRDAKMALLEEEITLYKDEVDNLRRALRSERASQSHRRVSPGSQRSESSLTEHDEASEAEADQLQDSKASSALTSPEGKQNEKAGTAKQCADKLLTTVDNLLSLDEEIKASEEALEKSSFRDSKNYTEKLNIDKHNSTYIDSEKGSSIAALTS